MINNLDILYTPLTHPFHNETENDLEDDLIIDTISSNLKYKTFDDINIIDLDELRFGLLLILE